MRGSLSTAGQSKGNTSSEFLMQRWEKEMFFLLLKPWLNAKEGSGREMCWDDYENCSPFEGFLGSHEAMVVSSRPQVCSRHLTLKLGLWQATGVFGEGNSSREQPAWGSADGLQCLSSLSAGQAPGSTHQASHNESGNVNDPCGICGAFSRALEIW